MGFEMWVGARCLPLVLGWIGIFEGQNVLGSTWPFKNMISKPHVVAGQSHNGFAGLPGVQKCGILDYFAIDAIFWAIFFLTFTIFPYLI